MGARDCAALQRQADVHLSDWEKHDRETHWNTLGSESGADVAEEGGCFE